MLQECAHCGKFFRLAPGVNRANRLTCSHTCKQYRHNRRVENARALHATGRTVRQIVKELDVKPRGTRSSVEIVKGLDWPEVTGEQPPMPRSPVAEVPAPAWFSPREGTADRRWGATHNIYIGGGSQPVRQTSKSVNRCQRDNGQSATLQVDF
jgi:hypothetical protein